MIKYEHTEVIKKSDLIQMYKLYKCKGREYFALNMRQFVQHSFILDKLAAHSNHKCYISFKMKPMEVLMEKW